MITDKDGLRRRLTERGIKPTFQRLAILGALTDNAEHPTIRALHRRLIGRVPTLSKTTLYSTLDLFAREGLVRPLLIDPAEARFDGIPSPHHHFACTSCGRILDVDLTCPRGRRGRIGGHRIDEVHGYFKGVCAECLLRPRRRSTRPSEPKTRRSSHA